MSIVKFNKILDIQSTLRLFSYQFKRNILSQSYYLDPSCRRVNLSSLCQIRYPYQRFITPLMRSHANNRYRYENHTEEEFTECRNFRSSKLFLTSLALTGFFSQKITDDSAGPVKEELASKLRTAVHEGDFNTVQDLLKKCTIKEVNARHKLGWQAIHVAAINGDAGMCKLLLNNGARIDDIDHYRNPRELARKSQMSPALIEFARSTEFNPHLAQVNFHGCTALHYAMLANDLDTIKVLVESGANPLVENDLGHKPLDYADSPVIETYLNNYTKEFIVKQAEREAEEKRLYPLEKRIKEVLVGQDAAISTVSATIRRKENGWFDEDHPLVFLFLGSSGIGKTELAKQIAKYLHKDDKKAFIRLDMSEYQEKHSVARMIGSPPGYIGHNEGGQLTDALTKCKNAVVLLDEIEKAHPDVLTILLQLFDEGRLTDGKGRTIECKDAIFIMTSNLASEDIAEHALQLRNEQMQKKTMNHNSKAEDSIQEQVTISKQFKDTIVRRVLKRHFKRDEFLGRINEMVYFLPFSQSELKELVTKELNLWKNRAQTKHSIDLAWDEKVVEVMCKGYDVHYGARSLKHEIERRIVNQLSEIHHLLKRGTKVHLTADESDLIKLTIV